MTNNNRKASMYLYDGGIPMSDGGNDSVAVSASQAAYSVKLALVFKGRIGGEVAVQLDPSEALELSAALDLAAEAVRDFFVREGGRSQEEVADGMEADRQAARDGLNPSR